MNRNNLNRLEQFINASIIFAPEDDPIDGDWDEDLPDADL